MKKIHLTESQIQRVLQEIALNGDEALNTTRNIQTAVKDTMNTARQSGVNPDNAGASVSFSADALKKNGLAEDAVGYDGFSIVNAAKKVLDKYAQEIDEFTSTNEVYEMINDVLETEYGFKNYNDDVAYKVMKVMSKMYSNYLEESKNMKVYTKKQLKEARVNKLVKESNKPITKKQLSIK